MKAILYNQPGSSDIIQWTTMPDPVPGPTDLLIRVQAAGLNRADLVQRDGRYPPPPGVTPVPGLEAAGEVLATGSGVRGFKPGDAVMTLVPGGAFATRLVADYRTTWPLPAGVPMVQAAALPEMLMTAWLNLIVLGKLRRGQSVLIHAGASGIGTAAIQLARWRGAEVIATAGSDEKLAFCRQLGTHRTYNYQTQPDWARLLKSDTGGVNLILDPVGGSSLTANLSVLKPDGKLVLIGLLGGGTPPDPVNLGQILVKRLQIVGSTLRSLPVARKAPLVKAIARHLIPLVESGVFQVPVQNTWPIHQLTVAQAWMESNRTMGKLVVTIGD